jgi:hypothetical protein
VTKTFISSSNSRVNCRGEYGAKSRQSNAATLSGRKKLAPTYKVLRNERVTVVCFREASDATDFAHKKKLATARSFKQISPYLTTSAQFVQDLELPLR